MNADQKKAHETARLQSEFHNLDKACQALSGVIDDLCATPSGTKGRDTNIKKYSKIRTMLGNARTKKAEQLIGVK